MANFCLPPDKTKVFLEALRSGKVDPAKLADMSSKERRAFFEDLIGKENAKEVNALFESKLLLKNQQQGMITWAKKVAGLSESARRDLVSKIEKMEKVLEPADEAMFLEDLAAKKLGADVTIAEAKEITRLADEVETAKEKLPSLDSENFDSLDNTARLEYGRKLVDLQDYVGDLKVATEGLTLKDFKTDTARAVGKSVVDFAGLTKSLKASLDNSVIGRQGRKVMVTHPKTWAKNAKQTFIDMYRTYKGDNVMKEIRADVLSRKNALNGKYAKEKLAVGVTEEAFPTNIPEKIPGIGRAFKASENAFVGFQYRTRADIFDKLIEIAEKSDADTKGIGKVVNSLTGRGDLGKLEPVAGTVNNVFFSPRFVKSNLDALTAHMFDKNLSPFAKRQAAINTIKIITSIATVMAIIEAVDPKAMETDPRSSDFAKLKIGNTRYDITGGITGLAVLAARVLSQSKKTTKGKIVKLNENEFGSESVGDVLGQFAGNKLSPMMAVIRDVVLRGKTANFEDPTVLNQIQNLVAPISISTAQELKDEEAAKIIISMIVDALGISVSNFK